MRARTPTCHNCRKPCTGAKVIVNGQWTCGTCAYLLEYPDSEIVPVSKHRPLPLQDETLFVPPPPIKRAS